ncbi:hypothetical protein AURDEDRAFT_163603 [Auricularia subglabra TFB-10046 SS5]|nr:hypothetical protein AURDEDRAFT_163603 [Auricularia subglabra TFB-10046 SS5]
MRRPATAYGSASRTYELEPNSIGEHSWAASERREHADQCTPIVTDTEPIRHHRFISLAIA